MTQRPRREIAADISRVSGQLSKMRRNRDHIYRESGYKNIRWLLNDLRKEFRATK